MNDNWNSFLESDLLERYLLGDVSHEESIEVEHHLAKYPEVRQAYDILENNLELFAKSYAQKTPAGLKEVILHNLEKNSSKKRFSFIRYGIAASVAVLIFAAAAFFFWNQNQNLKEENTLVNTKIKNLEQDMKVKLEDLRNQYIVLNNPETKKYAITGNRRAKELKAIAYINPVKKLSYINMSNVPQLPENQCFQMWTEVNGELVNLGVIKQFKDKNALVALPYAENAVSYITIEPEGGNTNPSVENIVANIAY